MELFHVARWPSEISVQWDKQFNEGTDRLVRCRPLLRLIQKQLEETVGPALLVPLFDSTAHSPARAAALYRTHEKIAITEADLLLDEDRKRAVAIRGEAKLAVQVKTPPQPNIVQISTRRVCILIFDVETDVKIHVKLDDNEPQKFTIPINDAQRAMVNRAFASPASAAPPAPVAEAAAPIGNADETGQQAFQLPAWLTEYLAMVLQNALRLHCLVCAAAPDGVTRPLVLDRSTLRLQYNSIDGSQRSQLRGYFHPSSATCLCHAHHIESTGEPQNASFLLEFCGRGIDGRCCPVHFANAVNSELDASVCLHNFSARVQCFHTNGIAMNFAIDLPAKAVSLLRVAAAAAATVARGGPAAFLREALDEAADEYRSFEDPFDNAAIAADCSATRVLRRGGVVVGSRAGKPCFGGSLTASERKAIVSRSSLFPKKRKR